MEPCNRRRDEADVMPMELDVMTDASRQPAGARGRPRRVRPLDAAVSSRPRDETEPRRRRLRGVAENRRPSASGVVVGWLLSRARAVADGPMRGGVGVTVRVGMLFRRPPLAASARVPSWWRTPSPRSPSRAALRRWTRVAAETADDRRATGQRPSASRCAAMQLAACCATSASRSPEPPAPAGCRARLADDGSMLLTG